MPAKNEQLIGAFASTLDFEQKLCLLLTPNRYQEFSEERNMLGYWLRREYMERWQYRLIVWDDPHDSLWVKYTRLGVSSWGRQVIEMSDVTALLAPASQVLGVEEQTNEPALKKDRGFPADTLSEMLMRDDLVEPDQIEEASKKKGNAPAPRVVHARHLTLGVSAREVDGDVERWTSDEGIQMVQQAKGIAAGQVTKAMAIAAGEGGAYAVERRAAPTPSGRTAAAQAAPKPRRVTALDLPDF